MRIAVSIVYLLLSSFLVNAQTSDWTLKYDRDNIKVYYRKPPAGNIYELRLTTTIKSSLSSIVNLLQDVDSYSDWVYKTIKANTVKTVNETEKYYYVLSDFPWPLNDRDYIAHTKLEQDAKTKTVTSTSVSNPKMLPVIGNVVRIEITKTKWVFTPLNKNEVLIDYTLLSDPGGTLPDWVINMALAKGPFETMQKFKKLLAQEKYKNAKLGYIQEF